MTVAEQLHEARVLGDKEKRAEAYATLLYNSFVLRDVEALKAIFRHRTRTRLSLEMRGTDKEA